MPVPLRAAARNEAARTEGLRAPFRVPIWRRAASSPETNKISSLGTSSMTA